MSEELVVQRTKKPVTKTDLLYGFQALGLQKGDVVLVHSSLSSLGWVVGKEIAVIQALLETVGNEGTIVMPSQSGDWSNPDDWQNPPVPDDWKQIIKDHLPDFDPLTTPTRCMGRIADAFWRYPGSIRSNHPQVSFSANGKLAHTLLDDHPLAFGLGDNSPLGKLCDMDAKILLLGVGYGNCTSIHLAEYRQENRQVVMNATRLNGKWIEYEEIGYDDSDFDQLGEDYEKDHSPIIGMIGNATCRVVRVKDIVDFSKEWFKKNRR